MHFWVFSFNRGQFLKNCIESIERCAPGCPISVFDDNSTDPKTLRVLEWAEQRCEVLKAAADSHLDTKHGGLYRNMQVAFELCRGDVVCFLQDDTQLVRHISVDDVAALTSFFQKKPRAGFVQPAFLRGRNEKTDRRLTRYDAEHHVYYVDRLKRSAGAYYSDICIFSPERLRQANWSFVSREANNECQAREHFEQLAYWGDPFVAWLPNVPAYRGAEQNWALKRAHELNGSGFFPIQILEGQALKRLLSRSSDDIPYAEKFLHAPGNHIEPWIYYPLQNKKWLKRASNFQTKLDRLLRSPV